MFITEKALSVYTTLLLSVFTVAAGGPQYFNESTDCLYTSVFENGKALYMTEELARKLSIERSTWHWTPYLRIRLIRDGDVLTEACLDNGPGASIDSFPDSLFTDEQLRSGAVILYIIFALYAFTLVAFICDDYFLPSVEIICEKLKIPQNVAAATFMAVATSCPEFFVNVVSTFVTSSDMGIGTIVGSAIFNALGVAAIGSLAAIRPIKIDRRPVTRDVLIYMVNVSVLVVIVWDGVVQWQEALVLGGMYFCYFIVMFNSRSVFLLYDKVAGCCRTSHRDLILHNGNPKKTKDGLENKAFDGEAAKVTETAGNGKCDVSENEKVDAESSSVSSSSVWSYPDRSAGYRVWWLVSWPLRLALSLTVPNPGRRESLYPLTFLMCIVWIGISSYFVSWSMTVIGYTFFIPESVMGMTFVAFGGCVPEACAIFIMSRRGEGGMGVSNALGANSLAILFALGVPWLIRTLTLLAQGVEEPVVYINSAGIDFVVGSLLVAAAALWLTLLAGRFMLRRAVGAVLACLYLVFVTVAVLVEMGILLNTRGDANLC